MTEAKKYQFEVEILGDAKDKTTRDAGEALLRADSNERRAEDAEVALRGIIEENFQLLGRIEGLKA